MDITFKVVSYHRLSPDQEPEKTFSRCNVTMGRSLDNDWVLPDPERIISGQHAMISYSNGEYYISDTSTNGLFINNSQNALGQGNQVKLNSGDHITMGEYELDVVIADSAEAQPNGQQATPPVGNDPMFAGLTPTFDSDQAPPTTPPSLKPMDFGENDDFFAPPQVKPQVSSTPVSTPVSSPNVMIPDDWNASKQQPAISIESNQADNNIHPISGFNDIDLNKGSMSNEELGRPIEIPEAITPEGSPPSPHSGFSPLNNIAPLRPEPHRPDQSQPHVETPSFDQPVFDTPNVETPSFDTPVFDTPNFGDPNLSSPDLAKPNFGNQPVQQEPNLSIPVQPSPIQQPAAQFNQQQPQINQQQPQSHAPQNQSIQDQGMQNGVVQQPLGQQQPAQGFNSNASDSELITALMRGLGIDGTQMPHGVSAEFMETAGEMLRTTVQGVMEILRARTNLKSEFRANQTMIRPAENNPLKFSPSFEDAMSNLFVKTSPSYLAPVKAMEEAITDIKTHQLALMAGFQGALTSLLDKFEPENIINHAGKSTFLKKAGYWEHYKKVHKEVRLEAEDNIQKLFGEEFARAYEQQSKGFKK